MTSLATQSLLHTEAVGRAAMLSVDDYDVSLDLACDDATFESRTRIAFTSRGGPTFVDLQPEKVHRITLNGQDVSPDLLDRGRLPLETIAGPNELVVEALMRFRNDGEGLHRSVDPADGEHYVYGMSFMAAAPSIFACFDQPDLKAPVTLHVKAPLNWTVVGNAPGEQVEPGVWEFQRSRPLSTYFVTLIAGPWHLIRDEHDGIPLGLSCRASIAQHLDADADELLTGTRQCFDEFHRLFGIRYPFGDYHQAFVPEFNAGAMENPGLVTFRDPMVFTSKVPRLARIGRMTTVAHEMAHQWFGNLTTPVWWDDLWLNESFAEYMGNRVTADVTEFDDAWVMNAYSRRQWGLTADLAPSTHPVAGNGAADASSALQDFDGISYTKGSAILKQLNARLGDEVFFRGVIDHFEAHRFGNATMHDLFGAWERAAGVDLSDFTDNWLRTSGPDSLVFDRDRAVVQRQVPPEQPADRTHAVRIAVAVPDGPWQVGEHELAGAESAFPVPPGSAVLIDPYDDSWAVTPPDPHTASMLVDLLPSTDDPTLRAGIWNGVVSAVYDAQVDPALALDLVVATVPTESRDDGLRKLFTWSTEWFVPLTANPDLARERVHAAALERVSTAAAGSTVQLTAMQGAIAFSAETAFLRGWLDGGLPAGATLDVDLRWRLLTRLAALGGIDRAELAAALADEPTAAASVEHVRAVASLPDAEAKAFAWTYFTGEAGGTNYDIEAAALGLWQAGQGELTDPYVDRYFDELPGLVNAHSGWVLADVAREFFPVDSLDPATSARAGELIDLEGLEPSLRRAVVDRADALTRRLRVVDAFGGPA